MQSKIERRTDSIRPNKQKDVLRQVETHASPPVRTERRSLKCDATVSYPSPLRRIYVLDFRQLGFPANYSWDPTLLPGGAKA